MSMEPIADSYTLLDIQPGTSLQEIQQSYEDLLTIWSPIRFDVGSRLRILTEKKIKEIHTAYDSLRGYYASEVQRIVAQSVIPAQTTLEPGQSIQFRLVGMNLDGKVVEIDYVRWSSNGGTINSSGVFSNQTKGCFTVTAHLGGFQAFASVEVFDPYPYRSEFTSDSSYFSVAESTDGFTVFCKFFIFGMALGLIGIIIVLMAAA
ncbi:MAG: J domain-containing protein [Leptolyngbyaceae cyanobacterium bins.302]|nr:J domain-containing protein [Leptolyngbyaceae cyanobacterium bins.302]